MPEQVQTTQAGVMNIPLEFFEFLQQNPSLSPISIGQIGGGAFHGVVEIGPEQIDPLLLGV